MRIDQVLTSATTPARAAATAQRWLVGQLLTIGVIGRVDETSIKLSVDGREVLARTSLALQPGSSFSARVTVAGPQPELSIVGPHTPRADASTPAATVLRTALGSTLPAQEPLRAVLTHIDGQRAPAAAAPPVAEVAVRAVQAQITALTSNLPALPDLALPPTLQRAVELAGPLLEARLAELVDDGVGTPPTQDLKFQLLSLRQAIDDGLAVLPKPAQTGQATTTAGPVQETLPAGQTLRALGAEVDAGVARITTHQLQHLAATDRGEFFAFAELPFRTASGVDTITLAIEGEPESATRGDSSTGDGGVAVNLEVPLAELGALRARIGLAGHRLAVTLWSEESGLRELIVEGIGELESRLRAAGFELTPVAVRDVAAPDPLRHRPARLIDTSA